MGNTLQQWRSSIGCWNRRRICERSMTETEPTVLHFIAIILAIILIIAGVELNPGPSNQTSGAQSLAAYKDELKKSLEETEDIVKSEMQRAEMETRLREEAEKKLMDIVEQMELLSNNDEEITAREEKLAYLETKAGHQEKLANIERELRSEAERKFQLLKIIISGKQNQNGSQVSINNDNKQEFYTRKTEAVDTRGQHFEIYVNSLLFLRSLTKGNFKLASNIDVEGSFDDIFLITENNTFVLQLKYNKIRKTLQKSQIRQVGGDFSVWQLCKAYHDLKKCWKQEFGEFDEAKFIMFTNRTCSQNPEHASWTPLLNSDGMCFSYTDDTDFKNLSTYQTLLSDFINGNQSVDRAQVLKTYQVLAGDLNKTFPDTKKLIKLRNTLESFNNLPDFKNFLSRLWFFTGQASLEELEILIKSELKNLCGKADENDLKYFLNGMKSWWEPKSKKMPFLKQNCDLWQKMMIKSHYIANINNDTLADLNMPDVKFDTAVLNNMSQNFQSAGQLFNIVNNGTDNSTVLSCLKVQQSLDKSDETYLLVNSKTFVAHYEEVQAIWGRWCKLLVVLADGSVDVNALTKDISKYPNKKLIFVSSPCPNLLGFQSIVDDVSFEEFDKDSQKKLLNTDVTFQDHKITLEQLLGNLQNFVPLLNTDVITEVWKGCTVGNSLNNPYKYYIPRSLELRDRVKDDILKHKTPQNPPKLIVRSPSRLDCLQDPGSSPRRDHSQTRQEEEQDEVNHQCIIEIVDDEENFLAPRNDDTNVHWLDFDGNCFIWKKSKGDVKLVKDYLLDETSVFKNVNSVMEIPHQFVILSAEPGMGKSTLIDHMASKTKEASPTTWVISLNLNKLSAALNNLPDNIKMPDAISFLLENCKITEYFKPLFRQKLEAMDDVCIFLDAYDEVCTYANKVNQILQHLQETNIKYLWVTTRIDRKAVVEENLVSLSFSLLPFSEPDQKEFLKKYWRGKNGTRQTVSDVDSFADEVLKLTKKSLNDRDRKFTGIPLLSMLIAEAFEKYLSNLSNLPSRVDLVNLFTRFIDRKFTVYYEKYEIPMEKDGPKADYKKLKDTFETDHMMAALLTLLPKKDWKFEYDTNSEESNHTLDVVEKSSSIIEDFEKGNEKKGIIMDCVNGIPVFLHKTFAEFYAALWYKDNYRKIKENMKEKLLNLDFQLVRVFFDRLLCCRMSVHSAVLNQDPGKVKELLDTNQNDLDARDDGGRTAVFLAVMNFTEKETETIDARMKVLQALLDKNANTEISDNVFGLKPLTLALRIEAWHAVGLLLRKCGTNHPEVLSLMKENMKNGKHVEDALIVANKHGFKELVEYIIDCGSSISLRIFDGSNKSNMIHIAAKNGHYDLVKFLVEEKNSDMTWRDSTNLSTPLMLAAEEGRLNIVKYMTCKSLQIYGENRDFLRNPIINIRDAKGKTALLRAAESGQLEIVEFLIRYTHTLDRDNEGNNILCCAAMSNNELLVKFLLKRKLDVNYHNNMHQTPLWLASRYGRLAIVKLLLLWKEAKINVWEHDTRYTPLHIAAMWGHLDVVKFLVRNNADYNARAKNGDTPLHRARKYKRSDVIQYLESLEQKLHKPSDFPAKYR
ncbi:uncharacterized protein [Periplaneta americana]|uniref:uncharacterized protein isoform X2 n=1 Tax=Periplaneta americana TaxID=6978 RepID=UPI0037E990AA